MNTLTKIEWVAGGMVLAAMAGAAIATTINKKPRPGTYWWNYNPDTVDEIQGRVMDVIYSGNANGKSKGVELLVEAGEEYIPVKLGPAWYINHQNITFKKGEKVMVKGSRIDYKKETIMVAATVKRGNRILKLREENGHPHWEAWDKVP